MEQLISRKLNELKSLAPSNREFKIWLSDSSLWSWIYSVYKIRGQAVSKAAVVDMCSGTIREDAPLACYSYVQNFKQMYSDMKSELSMLSAPDVRLFRRWAGILFEEISYRRSNPVVFEYGLIPCHFNSIEEELDACFRRFPAAAASPVESAGTLFLDIMRVFPYEDETPDMAMAALMYCLMSFGIPLPELSVGEDEFSRMIKDYADRGNTEPFCDMLRRCVYNRLDSVVMFARQAMENDEN